MKTVQILPLATVGLLLATSGLGLQPPQTEANQQASEQQVDAEPQQAMRYFLFTAKPSPEAWDFMKKNPGDRRAATEGAMKKIGAEMLGYYWGLTTGKNYIIAAVPDGRTAQAMLIQRLSTDLVLEYDAIELVESSEMPAVFDRLDEIEAADESLK